MTREAIELGFILNQISGYEFSMKRFEDRIRLQKTIYLLQVFGVNLGYDFSWYLRGPYCSSLTTNGFILQDIYRRLPKERIEFKDSDEQKKFERFQKFVGNKGWRKLEICASIHFIKKMNGSDNDVVDAILSKKCTDFNEEEIRTAMKEMRQWELVE